MSSGLHRKRFIRELESLKIVAHYSAVDESNLDQLLMSLSPELSVYTYEVFIDLDKLYAGKFGSLLLKNIQAAKPFILFLHHTLLVDFQTIIMVKTGFRRSLKCASEYQKNIISISDQALELPQNEEQIPQDIRVITKYNGKKWAYDYQYACMGKVVLFIEGKLIRTPSLSTAPSSTGPPNRRAIGALTAAIQSGNRQTSTSSHHRFSTRVGEHPPSMPSITPASSTDRNRRKHHTSVTTVYDRS